MLGGYTALMEAAGSGGLEVVETLLSHGADASRETRHGWTALMSVAARSGNVEIARILVEHGSDPCARHDEGVVGATDGSGASASEREYCRS